MGTIPGNREVRVRVDGEILEWAAAPSGGPQVSDLVPILFVISINDLSGVLGRFSFLFVDDLKILNSTSKTEAHSAELHTAVLWAT